MKLKSMKYVGKEEVFDIEVEKYHAFTLENGCIVHNSEHFLGIKQQSFADVSDGVENFYYISPENATYYGASDAICTFKLVPVTVKYFQEAKFSGKLDNNFLYPLMKYEQEKVGLDSDLLIPYERELKERIEELEKLIYKECGEVFKLNSPAQVAHAFQSIGIDTKEYTASGYMKTGIELLEGLPKEVKEAHPVIKYFIEYKTSFKYLSSYVKVLNKECQERGYLRSSYKTTTVPTGRLASGKDSKNTFFSQINTQSIPKPHPAFYYMLDLGDRTLFDRDKGILMGYQPVPIQYREVDGKKEQINGAELFGDKYMGVIESTDPHLNARKAFIPYVEGVDKGKVDDYVWFSADYCIHPDTLVELRDGTKIALKELAGKEVEIKTPYGYHTARNFRYTGKKKKCKLRLKSGKEVICSPDHKFYVREVDGNECWKILKDIKSTDYIFEGLI